MKNVIVCGLALSLLVVGCKKKEDAAAAGATGVAECDEYIAKYPACIAKMPAAAKPAAEAGFKAQVDAWTKLSATPDGKTTLKTMCKPTLDSLASNPMCK